MGLRILSRAVQETDSLVVQLNFLIRNKRGKSGIIRNISVLIFTEITKIKQSIVFSLHTILIVSEERKPLLCSNLKSFKQKNIFKKDKHLTLKPSFFFFFTESVDELFQSL